jgi:hypothetical protein
MVGAHLGFGGGHLNVPLMPLPKPISLFPSLGSLNLVKVGIPPFGHCGGDDPIDSIVSSKSNSP